jgi:hypothetical protein
VKFKRSATNEDFRHAITKDKDGDYLQIDFTSDDAWIEVQGCIVHISAKKLKKIATAILKELGE